MKQKKLLLLLSVIGVLVGCGETTINSETVNSETEWNPASCDENFGYASLEGKERKTEYSTYLSSLPTTLNYAKTMQAENGKHIANFVDGLVEHDRFGNLVPCLATNTGTPNEEYTEWTFELDSSKHSTWVTADGTYYADVKAEDFKTILKVVLNSKTASESAYLPLLVIDGAEEFVEATNLYYIEYASVSSESVRVRQTISGLASKGYIDKNATEEDLRSLLNFEQVGVVVDGNKITYKLTQAADYFPTMLTYLPFLPLNEQFYSDNFNDFGTRNTILYNGAYRLVTRNDTQLEYEKNESYWDKDNVTIEKVSYRKIGENLPMSYAREEYEAGKIDGFTLTSFDQEGWAKYVKGVDGKGNIQDPHHELTYSQENQNVDSSFMFYFNLNRPTNNPSGFSKLSAREISNTNKAIQFSYFRDAIFDALDLGVYNARNGQDIIEQQQEQINTYVPRNFISDDSGKDYFDYLLESYAKKHDVTTTEANEVLGAGKVNMISLEESVAQVNEALAKIEAEGVKLDYPIQIEYTGFYGDTTTRDFDALFIEATNERLNGCVIDEDYENFENDGLKVCNKNDIKVQLVANSNILTTQNYLTVSNAKDYTLFISGWGPDYGDPMTYAHTLVQGGDLADYIGIPEKGAKISAETQEKLDTYGKMVNDANAIVSSSSEKKVQRYEAFADAEIYMLEEMALIKPLYQSGQGYSCSISNFIPYRSPRAGYGLSGEKLKGMEILNEPLSSCERKALREEWLKEKENSSK